jgi:hypothetical protein
MEMPIGPLWMVDLEVEEEEIQEIDLAEFSSCKW